jgi:hypothetical protein
MLFYPKNGMTHLVLIVRIPMKEFILDSTGGKWETEDDKFSVTALEKPMRR